MGQIRDQAVFRIFINCFIMRDKIIEKQKYLMSTTVFGVCSYIGEKFRIRDSRIRLYFIYASFLTFGSPIIIYMVVAFWLEVKEYFVKSKRSVWDL